MNIIQASSYNKGRGRQDLPSEVFDVHEGSLGGGYDGRQKPYFNFKEAEAFLICLLPLESHIGNYNREDCKDQLLRTQRCTPCLI